MQITHITGPKDGLTEVVADGKLRVKEHIELQLKSLNDKVYIQVPEYEPIFINNREIIGTTEIRNDDVIQIDEGSPLLRVRFTSSDKKSVAQISADAKVLAQKNNGSSFFLYIKYFFKQLATYSSRLFRLTLTLLILLLLALAYNQYQYINDEAVKIKETKKHIDEQSAEIDKKTSELNDEITEVIKKSTEITDFSNVIEKYSGSVGYIDAEAGYKDGDAWITYGDVFDMCTPSQDYDLYKDYYDELRSYDEDYYFDVIWYGSGFLIDENGTILTNRHVAGIDCTIIEEFAYYGCDYFDTDMSEYDFPARLEIMFPNDDRYYELKNVRYHSDYDFAIATLDDFDLGDKNVLPLAKNPRDNMVGAPIITLGYPSGIDFLVYKFSSSDSRSSELNSMIESLSWADDRTELLAYILKEHLINTHVTRGIISQITDEAVSFDSSIYGGNSGGPIMNGSGEVIGIVTWKWGEMETFNLGVSSNVVLEHMDGLIADVL